MRDNKDPLSDLIRSIEQDLQGGGDWEPPEPEQPTVTMENPRRLIWLVLPLLILIFFNRLLSFYTDWIWYDSLNLSAVFLTGLYASGGLFLAGTLIFWAFLAINVLLMRRLESHGLRGTPIEQTLQLFGLRAVPAILSVGALLALFMGLSISTSWEEVLVYFNQSDFGMIDPIFERDVSFFLFTLPIWQIARAWLMTTVIITLLATAAVSGIGLRTWNVRTPVLVHLGILGALALLLVAWQYRLDAFQLVYSERGAVFGAGYTDVHAQLPAYNILTVVTILTAVLLLVTVFLRQAWRAIVGVLVIWIVVAILAGNLYPGLIQRFQVNPNELNLERPYIENNISFTRAAFDLEDIEVRSYDASKPLSAQDLLAQPETVTNVRLWDYRPLLETYNQIQALRQYYQFNNIDIDRYEIDGEVRQVMLAARELVPEQLDQNAQTWFNRKLVYTHGYGVAISPVAQITPDGLPEFLVKDLPPQGNIAITQPQIYFGELTQDYVIVNTDEPEFDYPLEQSYATNNFEAKTGISMGFMKQLLFALRFADINMLLNTDMRSDSQLLWRRQIKERVEEVAPFLFYDADPYIVISEEGKLYWFMDAYTVSGRFPYSEPTNFPHNEPIGRINYIRNPVKVVTDAYDGTMRFYLIEPDEPIAAAYARIFPSLFSTMDEMSDDLLAHIRYPNDLFRVQSEIYRTYHMIDPAEFYNKEDVWAWPQELFQGQSQEMEPYYVLMALPGSDALDFIQILPFTPARRENMLAWLAAQNDPDKYGEKIVYQFGKDSLIYGPQQIEARIDQDPEISALLSLWNDPEQGSSVIRGNLLVIPIGESLIYVEPLYLQADSGKIPELKRVIVATSDRVVMAENLGLALVELFGNSILRDGKLTELMSRDRELATTSSRGSGQGISASLLTFDENTPLAELITLANQHYEQAQTNLREGNWAGYGAEMDALQAVLAQLSELASSEE